MSSLTASSKKMLNSSDKTKSSDIIQLFLSMLICEKTVLLSDNKGAIVFQNFFLSKTFFISKDSQYFVLSFLFKLLQTFLCFLYRLRSV